MFPGDVFVQGLGVPIHLVSVEFLTQDLISYQGLRCKVEEAQFGMVVPLGM